MNSELRTVAASAQRKEVSSLTFDWTDFGFVNWEACKVEICPATARIEPHAHCRRNSLCDGVRTLRNVLKDDIGIGDHRVVCSEKHRPPGAK